MSDIIPFNNYKPGGIDAQGFGCTPTASSAAQAAGLQEAIDQAVEKGGGEVCVSVPGTYRPSLPATFSGSNVTVELKAGVIWDVTGLTSACFSATSKSNIRLCGDGKIVCAAASVPTFTSVTGLDVSVRIEDASGNKLIPTVSLSWQRVPSLFRVRLTGTGTCVMDSRDSLGDVTSSVASFTASGATDQIEFPFAGDDAVDVRFALTGSCAVEVL